MPTVLVQQEPCKMNVFPRLKFVCLLCISNILTLSGNIFCIIPIWIVYLLILNVWPFFPSFPGAKWLAQLTTKALGTWICVLWHVPRCLHVAFPQVMWFPSTVHGHIVDNLNCPWLWVWLFFSLSMCGWPTVCSELLCCWVDRWVFYCVLFSHPATYE